LPFGFTLVELLVVIAIIGVLIALLLPAVQAAREAAARMNCQSNMKNVTLAFHNYHDTHQAFPLGGDRDTMGTWALYVLPFIEQGALYSSYNFRRGYNNNTVDSGFSKGNQDLLSYLRIPAYTCPTDGDRKSTYSNYMHHNLVVCMGNAAVYQPNEPTPTTPNQGRGWVSYGDVTKIQGAMFWSGCRIGSDTSWSVGYKWVSMTEVTDGLSNTIALSETVQGERSPSAHSAGALDLRGLIWWGEGGQFTTYRSPNTLTADNVQFSNATTYPGGGTMHNPRHPITASLANNITIMSARSFHSSGVNAALGDGSVRFFPDTINIDTWRALATTYGGEASNQ
jgi:prepilin-type N-terminal cleavage/methylation domain-containing protein